MRFVANILYANVFSRCGRTSIFIGDGGSVGRAAVGGRGKGRVQAIVAAQTSTAPVVVESASA